MRFVRRKPGLLLVALLGVLLLGAGAPLHPLHVSLTELNYNAPELTLEISHRIFRDDLELALRAQCQCPIDVQADRPSPNLDSLAARYIQSRMRLRADAAVLRPRYLGHELDGEVIWLHLEASELKPFGRLEIMQDILFEMYDDQSGVVNFTCGGQLRSARLQRGKPTAEIACGR